MQAVTVIMINKRFHEAQGALSIQVWATLGGMQQNGFTVRWTVQKRIRAYLKNSILAVELLWIDRKGHWLLQKDAVTSSRESTSAFPGGSYKSHEDCIIRAKDKRKLRECCV